MGFDMGKSESQQQQTSANRSVSGSTQTQSIWENQIPYLESLYSTGAGEISRMLKSGADPSGYGSEAKTAWSRMLGGGENPALGGAIQLAQERAGEGFAENVLPALTDSAISAGGLGGDRGAIAAGIAGRGAAREQGDIATRMTFDDYQGQQQRIMEALQMTGGLNSLSQSSLAPLLALAQIIGRPQMLQRSDAYGSASGEGQGTGSSDSWKLGASWTGA